MIKISEEIESGITDVNSEEVMLSLLHENECLRRSNKRAGIIIIIMWLALVIIGIKLVYFSSAL